MTAGEGDIWKRNGETYVRDVPDPKIKFDATFYAMFRSSKDGLIGLEETKKNSVF